MHRFSYRVKMFTRRQMMGMLAVLLAFTVSHSGNAQETRDAGAQWRDAYAHTLAGKLYATAYDANELWVLALPAGERLNRIPLGKGPASLAYDADTDTLAIVNRLDNSVSLVDRSSERVLATIPTGQGPADLVSLGAGQFAVAESFEGRIGRISAAGEISYPFPDAPAVPAYLAATEGRLIVGAAGGATLHVYTINPPALEKRVTLPGNPTFLTQGFRNAVLVGLPDETILLEIPSGDIRTTFDQASRHGAIHGEEVLLLHAEGVSRFDATGGRLSTIPLSLPAQRIASGMDWSLVLSPAQRQWRLIDFPELVGQIIEIEEAAPVKATMPGEAELPEATPTPDLLIDEAEPVNETDEETPAGAAAPQGAVELNPAPESVAAVDTSAPMPGEREIEETSAPENLEETPPSYSSHATESPVKLSDADTVAPESMEPKETPESEEPAEWAAPDETAAQPGGTVPQGAFSAGTTGIAPSPSQSGSFGRFPLPSGSVRAPRAPIAGQTYSQQELSRRSIRDVLLQPTQFGSEEAGFQAPDWNEPLRDIEADQMDRDFNINRVDLSGNVRLRLGDMLFSADSFSYTEDLGILEAEGNVYISQEASNIEAEYLNYTVPPETSEDGVQIIRPVDVDATGTPRRLQLGRVKGRNVTVTEPTREFTAENVDYDFLGRAGVFNHAHGRAGVFYWGADELRVLGPASAEGDEVWVTTCDHDPPHYRIRVKKAILQGEDGLAGSNAQLELLGAKTPFILPRFRDDGIGGDGWTLDVDTGRRAEIGSFLNVGQRYEVSREVALGPRLYITQKEGVGFGGDIDYDFSDTPTSRLYRTKGQASGLYTTEDRGYIHWYHRWKYGNDLTLKTQIEHWSDEDFYKDFYYDRFRNRTSPRSFAALTYRQPTYIAEGALKVGTHGFVSETERLPEAAFYLLDRPLTDRLHLAFDSVTGYYNLEPDGEDAGRTVNVARLTYDWDPLPALSITPFAEVDLTYYTELRDGSGASGRITPLVGVTAQSRFHKVYPGRWGFSGFKHIVIPSVTLSYRPESDLSITETPRFDDLDRAFGRTRIESKLTNVIYGRDAESGEVWQVARLTLYQGNDFWNESKKSDDYEVEIDIRPRPWWGMQLVGEKHVEMDEGRFDSSRFFERRFRNVYQSVTGRDYDVNDPFGFNTRFTDYERILAQVYYDSTAYGGKWNGRAGFAYTETGGQVFNREALYGFGYRINENWGVGFEHRYDFEDGEFRSQTYEIRRTLHCWETAIRVRDRESGFDVDVEFNITAFPGNSVKF